MAFSEPLTKKLNSIIAKSETKRSALIPVLREIQNEYGYLSAESMEQAANMLEISPSGVQNVATFYTMFFTEPAGETCGMGLQNSILRS
jgi:NADH-quinone oxidoreductase subunit E